MAYSERALDLRRCIAAKAEGTRCHAYAVWGADTQTCFAHGGRSDHRGASCRCPSYPFPHRPGGGLCEWPNRPLIRSEIKAGHHSASRHDYAYRLLPKMERNNRRKRRMSLNPISSRESI